MYSIGAGDGGAMIYGAIFSPKPSWFESPVGKLIFYDSFDCKLMIQACLGTRTAISLFLKQPSDEEFINSLAEDGCCWRKYSNSHHKQLPLPLFESDMRRGFVRTVKKDYSE